ncbi:MAG: glycosyltransferase family 4 protein [Bacteroidetes bacterium]|nr:glycosyltransferase family 4 protein [Bacteroidota bacterium]
MSETQTVLHLVNTMEWGGVRRHVLDLADGLTAHGIRSIIAAWLPEQDPLHDDVRTVHLPLYAAAGGRKSPSGFLDSLRILRELIQGEQVQILHMHSRYATMLGSLAARGSRVRRLYTAHNTFDDMRWLPWYPDDIIAPGAAVRDHFLAHARASDSRRLHVVAHGVTIPALPSIALDQSARFCFAGRLCEEKGVRVLYDALLLLQKERDCLPFVDVIGDGPLFHWLEERVASNFESGTVRLHGYVRDTAPLIAGATALLFPSLGLDSAPYTPLEAMALGIPVIASDIRILAQLVLPGLTGRTFPVGDAAALASALSQAMNERERMRSMGLRGRELVREEHDMLRMCAETADVYRQLPRK